MGDSTVEVLGIFGVMDVATGKPAFTVNFGHYAKVDEAVRERSKAGGGAIIPVGTQQIGIVELQFTYDFKGVIPYRIGTKWKLSVGVNGELSLKEVKA